MEWWEGVKEWWEAAVVSIHKNVGEGGKMRFKNIEGAIFIRKNTIKGVFKI